MTGDHETTQQRDRAARRRPRGGRAGRVPGVTGLRRVDRVPTDAATFEITGGDQVLVRETWDISFRGLRSRLDVPLTASAP